MCVFGSLVYSSELYLQEQKVGLQKLLQLDCSWQATEILSEAIYRSPSIKDA